MSDEDWEHVLVECAYNVEFRNLDDMGVVLTRNISFGYDVDVRNVLSTRENYEAVSIFADTVFKSRKLRRPRN